MRVGILGSGMIGGTLARLLAHAAHNVKIGGRNPDKIAKVAAGIGSGVEAGTLSEAATFGDIVILLSHGRASSSRERCRAARSLPARSLSTP